MDFLWDMLRTYSRQQTAVKVDPLRNLAADSPGHHIMNQPPARVNISFEPHPAANPESRRRQLKRFQLNPEPNWGPKMRAKTSTVTGLNKQQRNQDRKQRNASPSPNEEEEDEAAIKQKKQKCDDPAE